MQNTTRPTVVALESIHPEILFAVSGGCHKKAPPPAPAPAAGPITQVVQMPVTQLLACNCGPAAAPPPAPVSRGPEVSTSVSINGKPA